MLTHPDIVLVLADDMGYSDLGCFGGEIETPNLDRLAAGGVRLSQFYNTARCSPSRASLLTGLHPHQTGIGILNGDDRPEGYAGSLNDRCVTIAEVLASHGYATYLSGKWHVANERAAWPTRRGFEEFFGTVDGGGNYFQPSSLMRGEQLVEEECQDPSFYYTDAITDAACSFVAGHAARRSERPFFLYVGYTASHWPLHAPTEAIERKRGCFDAGWDALREQRARRLIELGVLDETWPLSERDPRVPPWEDASHKGWEVRRMEVYAAQVERLDVGVGRLVQALETSGRLDNTLFLFLSDNGGCWEDLPGGDAAALVERALGRQVALTGTTRDGRPMRFGNSPEIEPGGEDTFASYGRAWANLSNAPFREYKSWVHEGGIATPLIVHWPQGLDDAGAIRHHPHQLPDVMSTLLDAAGAIYPTTFPGRDLLPAEGTTMLPTLRGEPSPERLLYWEHEGNAGIRRGRWKLVRKYPGEWELYDMVDDRTELHDRAGEQPELVAELARNYELWAKRCGVLPREHVLADYRRRGIPVWDEAGEGFTSPGETGERLVTSDDSSWTHSDR